MNKMLIVTEILNFTIYFFKKLFFLLLLHNIMINILPNFKKSQIDGRVDLIQRAYIYKKVIEYVVRNYCQR